MNILASIGCLELSRTTNGYRNSTVQMQMLEPVLTIWKKR
jgi:hypothetical protein